MSEVAPDRPSKLAKVEDIRRYDLSLREKLRHANASPFLGQYDLPSYIEQGIDALLCVDRPLGVLVRLSELAPAAAVCFISRIASAKAGSESFGEFYPHLEQRLDYKLSNDERNELGAAFRAACALLLLPIPAWEAGQDSNSWKWRRLYMMQAGVIRNDLKALAMAALDTHERIQLPDGFDLEETKAWQSELCEGLVYGHKLLRQILELDVDAWHASAIGRLKRGEQPQTQFEHALVEALHYAEAAPRLVNSVMGRFKPEIRLEGGQVVLRTPQRADTNWTIDAGWQLKMGSDQAVEIPIVDVVRWRTDQSGDDWHPLTAWSGAPILLFDAGSGRLLRRPARGSTCEIDASDIFLVTRETIKADGVECQSADGKTWLTYLKLTGAGLTIAGWLDVRSRSMLRWSSEPHLVLEGKGVFGSAGAYIHADLSHEQQANLKQSIELLLRFRGGHPMRFPFDFSDPQHPKAHVDFGKLDLGNFGLVSAALVQTGTERPIMSSPSVWFWPNLLSFDGSRFLGCPPDNLDLRNCKGCQPDSQGISLTIENTRLAHLAFNLTDRSICFRLPRQGVALEIEEQGHWRSIPLGQRVVDDGRQRRLRIWSGDKLAALQIGDQIVRSAFAGSGYRMITLNGIASVSSTSIKFWRSGNEGDAIELLSIVKSSTPLGVELLREGGAPVLLVRMAEEIKFFELSGFDLLSGDTIDLALSDSALVTQRDRNVWKIRVGRNALGVGNWLLDLQAIVAGEDHLRPVRMPRGDRLALLVKVEAETNEPKIRRLAGLERDYFVNLSRALTRLWAKEVWEQSGGLMSIEKEWTRVGKQLARTFSIEDHAALLKGVGQAVPFDSPPSWVPQCHPIDLAPQLYSGSLTFIHELLIDADDEGCRGLADSLTGDPCDISRHQQALARFESRLDAAGGGSENMNLKRRGLLTGLADKCFKAIKLSQLPKDINALVQISAKDDILVHHAPFLATYIARQTRLSINPNLGVVSALLTDTQGEVGLFLRLAPELFGLHLKLWAELKA